MLVDHFGYHVAWYFCLGQSVLWALELGKHQRQNQDFNIENIMFYLICATQMYDRMSCNKVIFVLDIWISTLHQYYIQIIYWRDRQFFTNANSHQVVGRKHIGMVKLTVKHLDYTAEAGYIDTYIFHALIHQVTKKTLELENKKTQN